MDSNPQLAKLSRYFEKFAADAAVASSPLYTRLTHGIAADPVMLEIAAKTRSGQPPANMLFGAVHSLLLQGANHPLKEFYASVVGEVKRNDDPYPFFRDFCLQYQSQIVPMLENNYTQTNEVRRCACLMPAFEFVFYEARQPLSLIEVGASAGLNLLWDMYSYSYGDGLIYGDANSPLYLDCKLEGDKKPLLQPNLPAVAWRTGVDLHPLDLSKPEDVFWLRALIWPEQLERHQRFEQAVSVAQKHPLHIVGGDALKVLPELLPKVPPDTALCIYHSMVLYQFTPEMKEQFWAILAEHSAQRPIYLISFESDGGKHPDIELEIFDKGTRTKRQLARCHAHGVWLEWL